MNNQVTGTLIDLGTQIADPLQRLKSIMTATAAMKRRWAPSAASCRPTFRRSARPG